MTNVHNFRGPAVSSAPESPTGCPPSPVILAAKPAAPVGPVLSSDEGRTLAESLALIATWMKGLAAFSEDTSIREHAQWASEQIEAGRVLLDSQGRKLTTNTATIVTLNAKLLKYECPCGVKADSIEDHDCIVEAFGDGPDREVFDDR